MARKDFNDLLAFRAVAMERSFTRAAARLGVSTSAVSHALRGMEERIGIRLLNRTTRSVVPTEAGERLLTTVSALFDGVEAELASLGELRDRRPGISASRRARMRLGPYWSPHCSRSSRPIPN